MQCVAYFDTNADFGSCLDRAVCIISKVAANVKQPQWQPLTSLASGFMTHKCFDHWDPSTGLPTKATWYDSVSDIHAPSTREARQSDPQSKSSAISRSKQQHAGSMSIATSVLDGKPVWRIDYHHEGSPTT